MWSHEPVADGGGGGARNRSVTEALEVAARERGYELKSLFFLSRSAMFVGYSAEWFRAIEEKQGVTFKHAAPITLPTLKHLGEASPSLSVTGRGLTRCADGRGGDGPGRVPAQPARASGPARLRRL